ncbi:hypothetical protein T459_04231 [Capsicum annuum]|uniref:UDP-N-acetylmuramate dehydrogenase n=1 Tax=Capsicum annuum TaxID=4072 RepID=A0A2G3A4H3_CAPAN|nr:hypothetical protein T459_04231 [Capsicum annuum]
MASHLTIYHLPLKQPTKLDSCHVQRSISCNFKKQESAQNSTGLPFIHRKKLLSDLTTWGIGGPCNYFIQVFNHTQLVSALRYCNEQSMRFMILGKGSNCLFDDVGFDGCIILNRIEFMEKIEESGVYRVGSGYPFNCFGVVSANDGFSGLEFAAGVPGTVGGAAYMNAGANGQETAAAIDSIEIVTNEGESRMLKRRELNFGYRLSPFQELKDLASITAVTFRLKFSKTAREMQQEYLARRWRTQPLGQRSAGSVFRNPSSMGFSAAELIEKTGLKGLRVGGAMVSNKHANFFINCGCATSQDMLELIGLVKDAVNQKFGVELKEEISYIHPS